MLSVAVHKDVAEYQPKILGKLTLRTLVCIACALGASVLTAVYLEFVIGVSMDDWMVLVYAAGLPFWAAGFWRPHRMKFEQFVPLWLQHKFTNNRIFYTSSLYRVGIATPHGERKAKENVDNASIPVSKSWGKLRRRKGIEAWCPGDDEQFNG